MKFLLASAFCLLAFTTQAVACQCAGTQRPCEAYGDASAIFVGTVTFSTTTTVKGADYEFEQRLVRLHVDRSLKNVTASDVEVMTGLGDSDCGYGFRLGGQYLVYAYADDKKVLSTSICTRTRPLTNANADLEYINGLSKAVRGGTIFGQVGLHRPSRGYEDPYPPVKDAKILIKGPKNLETKTDAEGKYSVSGLPPGKYKVRVDLPDGLSIYNPETELEVHDRGCRQTYFLAEPDTRITGKVSDAQGLAAADVLIELVPISQWERNGVERNFPEYVRSDKEGRFVVKLVKPGRYYLGVRIVGSAGATYVPYPQTYYPGVKDQSQATVITITEGQSLELDELVLPPRFIERTLNGVVVDAEGKPVAGAAVWLKERQYEDRDMPYRRDTDSEGRFSYPVYEGIKYELNAFVDSAAGVREMASSPVEIVITSNQEPIRIVVKKQN